MKIKITLFLVFLNISVNSQSINLVASFGNNGTKAIELDGEADYLRLVNVNNTSLFAYSKTYLIANENTIYKLDFNGNLDNGFGTNGVLTLPNYKSEFKVLMQGNDKFIVSFGYVNGYSESSTERAILRYNLDGSLDTTFGTNGELRLQTLTPEFDDIVILDDLSMLIKDSQKITKILSNGSVDTAFGTSGSITSTSAASINRFQSDILLQSNTELQKLTSNGLVVNKFAANGVYSFGINDYKKNKVFGDKILTIEEGDLPVNLYFLNENGQLNNSFDNDGILNISDQSASLSYINDFLFVNNKFFFVGETSDINPFILSYDLNGNLVQLNSSNFYKENSIASGDFTSIVAMNDKLYIGGDYYDSTNNKWYYTISKYDIQSLSNQNFEKVNNFKVENPVGDKLNIKALNKLKEMALYSIEGRLIDNNIKNNDDVSHLNKGIYLLKMTDENNNNQTIKIIKK